MRRAGEAPQLDLLQPRPGNPADLELPRVTSKTPEVAASPFSAAEGGGGNIHTRPSGAEIYTQGRAQVDVDAMAALVEKGSPLISLKEGLEIRHKVTACRGLLHSG